MYTKVELKVNVKKAELLEKLKENRALHLEEYKKAKVGFRVALEKELKQKLKAVKAGESVDLSFENHKPEKHLDEYDDVIGMLEFAEDEEIELNHNQYKQYFKNEWDWTYSWSVRNSDYVTLSASVEE